MRERLQNEESDGPLSISACHFPRPSPRAMSKHVILRICSLACLSYLIIHSPYTFRNDLRLKIAHINKKGIDINIGFRSHAEK